MPEVRSHRLRVAEVIEETGDACSVVFDVPPEKSDDFAYQPGQFLTLRIPSDRCGSVARCYSLSSSPHLDRRLQVTVKRTEEGYASHWVCDNVRPGSEIEVLPPAGVFTPADLNGDLLLFAGGSGITPVMSIIKSAIATGTGRLLLVYANRDERSVIFGEELRLLAEASPDRLTVIHWLESVQGLPTVAQLRALAEPFSDWEFFTCGPGPYMKAVTTALKDLDVPRSRRHVERFSSLGGNPFESVPVSEPAHSGPASVTVDLDGSQQTLSWPAEQKLLDLLLEKGLDAPYSCREGACSACACRLVSGEVKMLNNEVLEQEDLDEGIILACQSLPVTDDVEVSYQ